MAACTFVMRSKAVSVDGSTKFTLMVTLAVVVKYVTASGGGGGEGEISNCRWQMHFFAENCEALPVSSPHGVSSVGLANKKSCVTVSGNITCSVSRLNVIATQ